MKCSVVCAVIAVLFAIYFIKAKSSHNNVCKTFDDYYSNRDTNPNCYYNPEYDLKVPEIIRRRGYPVETYHVTTKDGYILTVFRIPYGKDSVTRKPGAPVFIQHGLSVNCAAFVNIGNKSLGFILADAGYDVWLGNFRGTLYSRNHTHLSDDDREFWNFSFHEKGIYDVAAQLDLIFTVAKQKVIYIGYSIGTAAAYIYGVTYPDAAQEKVKVFISLAPMAFISEMKSWVKYGAWILPYVEAPVIAVTKGALCLRGVSHSSLLKFICSPFPFQMKFCQSIDMFSFGVDYEQNDPETVLTSILQNRDCFSLKTLTHSAQLIKHGGFKHFDYGAKVNEKTYGATPPPDYDLSRLRVPVYLVRGENDFLMTKEDVERLHATLPEDVNPYNIYVVKYDKFSHCDFIMARDVVPLLYSHIVDFINKL